MAACATQSVTTFCAASSHVICGKATSRHKFPDRLRKKRKLSGLDFAQNGSRPPPAGRAAEAEAEEAAEEAAEAAAEEEELLLGCIWADAADSAAAVR